MMTSVNFESEDAVNSYLARLFSRMESGEIKPSDARADLADLLKAALADRRDIVDDLCQDDQADDWTE